MNIDYQLKEKELKKEIAFIEQYGYREESESVERTTSKQQGISDSSY